MLINTVDRLPFQIKPLNEQFKVQAEALALRAESMLSGQGYACQALVTPASAEPALSLICGDELTLTSHDGPEPLRYTPDLVAGRAGWRRQHGGGVKEPLAKACGVAAGKRPRILDGTPGWLRDSMVLASLGCQVWASERELAVFLLMEDALRRAAQSAGMADIVACVHLHYADMRDWLDTNTLPIDVIYLDPMFPPRENSAKVKKDMQLLQQLAVADSGDDLLAPAMAYALERVVVKRPDYAPPLAGMKPQGSVPAGAHRFDIYRSTRTKP